MNVVVKMDKTINIELRYIAQEIGITKNALIAQILSNYCKKYQKEGG